MLTFVPVTQRSLPRLRRYYVNCGYRLCEYSALVKLMWCEHLHPEWTEAAGCLIVRSRIDGKLCFDYPVPGPAGDVDAALGEIERWCTDKGMPLSISVVPAAEAPRLLARYPRFRLSNLRSWRDYLYDAESLREFPGRHYSGQRNHVNKFRRLCPGAVFRPLGKGDEALVEQFWRAYDEQFSKDSAKAKNEVRLAKKMLRLMGLPWLLTGGLELDGRLLSLAMAERCGDTLHIHIEKALYSFEGVYPATVQEFARHFATDGVRWINREDDADDRGLRTSKLQYLPSELAEKYCFDVENELFTLPAVPTLTTERLTLSAFTEADKPAYNALCLDDARNRFWGYDYREDWRGEPLEDYFLDVTRQDFAHHAAVNFAVRLDGKCIGEAVLYRFDWRGGAELGCRIAPEYAHNGYGTEAFAAVADWGLYKLQLAHVVAKCYKENDASYRMLASCMRRSGEDETFFYFNKEV
jgi:hypothetical protein